MASLKSAPGSRLAGLLLAGFLFAPSMPLEARGTVSVLPGLQFLPEGGSALLKARAGGRVLSQGWKWELSDPEAGTLEAVAFGWVIFTATQARPWSTVRIQATSLEEGVGSKEAVIEILPSAAFRVIGGVLGPRWIEELAIRPNPVRLQQVEPDSFPWPERYIFHAEIDTADLDQFAWQFTQDSGCATHLNEGHSSRETVVWVPSSGRATPSRVRVTVTSIARGDLTAIVCSPADAVQTFRKTTIDYLVLGDYLIDRRRQPSLAQTNQPTEKELV